MLSKQNQTPDQQKCCLLTSINISEYEIYIIMRKVLSLICIDWMYFIKCRHVPIWQCLSPISLSGTSRAHWSHALTFLIASCILLVQSQLKSRNSTCLWPTVTTTNGHNNDNHLHKPRCLKQSITIATLCIHWWLSGTWKVLHNTVRIVSWKDRI